MDRSRILGGASYWQTVGHLSKSGPNSFKLLAELGGKGGRGEPVPNPPIQTGWLWPKSNLTSLGRLLTQLNVT